MGTRDMRHLQEEWDGETWFTLMVHEDGSIDSELFDEEPDLIEGVKDLLGNWQRDFDDPDPDFSEWGEKYEIALEDWPTVRHSYPLLVRAQLRMGNMNGGDSIVVWEMLRHNTQAEGN